jgi:hypothetical protein
MTRAKAGILWTAMVTFTFFAAQAQTPQQLMQQVVDTERAANQNDHSQWIYFEEIRKPKEHTLQWVAGTSQGNVCRVLEKDEQKLPEPEQRELIDKFLHDPKARNKQLTENRHDDQQVDDFLKLLPVAFVWTEISSTPTDTSLHFEPAPSFHPPTRESRVFAGMTGDIVIDNQQHRIRSMSGHLIHDVTFGGGLLGRLKEGSSFSLDQAQVAPTVWELTSIRVHLEGNALLFKSISLQQDDQRCRFEPESASVTLDQAAGAVMSQPETAQPALSSLPIPCR